MAVHQVDFFKGTSQIFARNIMKIAKANTFDEGDFIFQAGDPARHFYILLEGCVHLSIGRSGEVFFIIKLILRFNPKIHFLACFLRIFHLLSLHPFLLIVILTVEY